MTNAVSLLDAAQLAGAAYTDPGVEIPAGWIPLGTAIESDSGDDSFMVYQNQTTKTIAFAFKGSDTKANFINDLLNSGSADWEALKGKALAQLDVVKHTFPDYQIVAIGHSLGGAMAQSFALLNGVDGYGFNSLPISVDTLIADYGSEGAGRDKIAGYAGSFKETNADGDIATSYYSNGIYISTQVTTLPSPYAQNQNLGKFIAKYGGGPLGLALFAAQAGRSHLMGTIISVLKGYQLSSGDGSTVSAQDAIALLAQAGEKNVLTDANQLLTFKLTGGLAVVNPDLAGNVTKIGDPTGTGTAAILKIGDPNETQNSNASNTVTSDIYEDGKLTSRERMTINSDGSYDLLVLDPVSDAEIVKAHVNSDGTYNFDIYGDNLWRAPLDFKLPTWAIPPNDIYMDASNGPPGDDRNPDPDWTDRLTYGSDLTVVKTDTRITLGSDSKNYIHYDTNGNPIDARQFDSFDREKYYIRPDATSRRYYWDDPSAYAGVSPDGSRQEYMDRRWYFYTEPGYTSSWGSTPTLTVPEAFASGGSGTDRQPYSQGQGGVFVSAPITGAAPATTTFMLASNLSRADVKVRARNDGTEIELTDNHVGDSVTIELGALNSAAVRGVQFSDGSVWSINDILETIAQQEQLTPRTIGTLGADVLTAAPGLSYLRGSGGNDTFNYTAGSGTAEVDERDDASSPNNLLVLSGVNRANLSASASLDGEDIVLRDGVTGDLIALDRMLVDPSAGVQSVLLSDGTSLSGLQLWELEMSGGTSGDDMLVGNDSANQLDGHGGNDLVVGGGGGDTFVFAAGYGALEIRETDLGSAPANVLTIGSGIDQSSLSVHATGDGKSLVIEDGISGDSITLDGALVSDANGVQQIRFADGSTLTAEQLIRLETTGHTGDDSLHGSDRGDVIDGAGGSDLAIGGGGGDTFVFDAGYGDLEISEFDWNDVSNNVLQLGSGIDRASVQISRSSDGTALILMDGIDGDRITIDDMVSSPLNGIKTVRFADGSSMSRTELLALGNASTTGDDTLIGTDSGDLIDGLGGNDLSIGHGGSDTFVFVAGYGNLEIEEYGSTSSTLQLGGISEAEILVTASDSGDIVINDGLLSDQITIDGMAISSTAGIQQVTLDDGTTLSRDQILRMATTGTTSDEILYGSIGADLFDGHGGADVEVGRGGGDTFVFNYGYGQLEITEEDDNGSALNILQLGAGIDATSIVANATSDHTGIVLSDGAGDQITLDRMLVGNGEGIQAVQFADGTTLSRSALIQMVTTGTGGSDDIYGSNTSDTFDGNGGGDYAFGGGGGDTFVFDQGYGLLDIDETDYDSDPRNVLKLGPGIDPTALQVVGQSDLSLHLTDGIDGDQIIIDRMLSSEGYGIQEVDFADGTKWSRAQLLSLATTGTSGDDYLLGSYGTGELFDGKGGNDFEGGFGGGDTFVFDAGYGQLDISESDTDPGQTNILSFGDGVDSSMVNVRATLDGSGLVLTDNMLGDQVTLEGTLSGGNDFGVQQVQFANGTVWSREDLIEKELQSASYSDETIAGSTGADLIDGKGGNDILVGNGGGDTFVFQSGYGQLEIVEVDETSAPSNVLTLGAGIEETAVRVRASTDGSSLVLTAGSSGDQITIDGMLVDPGRGIQQVQFANGTVWTWAQLMQMETTGTAGDDRLIGTVGADLFDGKGGNDVAIGGGGGDTFVFNQGYGHLDITEQKLSDESPNILQLGEGIEASMLVVTENNSSRGITITDSVDGDQITLEAMSWDSGHGVQFIEFADGTIWTGAQIRQMAMTGTDGNDRLYGSVDADVIDGKGGSDYVEGGGGGDTFAFERGYGVLEIDESDYSATPANVLKLGPGIALNDLTVSTLGRGIVVEDGHVGDKIVIDNVLSGSANGIQLVQLADGTSLSRTQLLQLLTTGTTGSDTIVGTTGADVFDGKGGGDYFSGNGGDDTFVYHSGYGHLTIDQYDQWNGSVLQFGPGIDVTSLSVHPQNGVDLVIDDGVSGDEVVLRHALQGSEFAVQTVQFADGLILSEQQLMSMASIGGTTGNDVLVGSSNDDTFVGLGGNDSETGLGGFDTYALSPSYGTVIIQNGTASNNSAAGELLITGQNADNVWLRQMGSDLEIDVMGTGTKAIVKGWFGNDYSKLSQIGLVGGSDGSVTVDSQISQLIQAMATYSAAHAGFDPTSTASTSITDPTVLTAVASAWHATN